MKKIMVLGALLATCCAAGYAEQQVRLTERFRSSRDAELSVWVSSGSVHLVPCEGDGVVVEGTIADGMNAVIVTGSDGRWLSLITYDKSGRADRSKKAELEIRFPSFCSLEVSGSSSRITIEADGGQRSIDASAVDGSITIRGAGSSVTARTFSGDIDVRGRALRLDAWSATGRIFVQGRVGRLDAESMSGDVTLDLRDLGSADISTISGAIAAACTFAYPETVNVFRATSERGPITLAVSPHLAASFELTLTPEAWIAGGTGIPAAAAIIGSEEDLIGRIRLSPETADASASVTSSGMGFLTTMSSSSGRTVQTSDAMRVDKWTRSLSTGSDATQVYLTSRDGTISLEFRELP